MAEFFTSLTLANGRVTAYTKAPVNLATDVIGTLPGDAGGVSWLIDGSCSIGPPVDGMVDPTPYGVRMAGGGVTVGLDNDGKLVVLGVDGGEG